MTLIDVCPEACDANSKMGGDEFVIANDVFRSRYRESFETPKPMVPTQVSSITIDLRTRSSRFQQEHCVRRTPTHASRAEVRASPPQEDVRSSPVRALRLPHLLDGQFWMSAEQDGNILLLRHAPSVLHPCDLVE